jgi:predicted  nucleic acid-binding Zn-ribbon protein
MKEKVISVEESLYSIACRLDELTGNAMGNSYLKLDMEPVELDGVEDRLEKLNEKVEELIGAVSDISTELQTLSTISNTLENMLAFYIEFNQTKKTK